jgi:hypothetical protein
MAGNAGLYWNWTRNTTENFYEMGSWKKNPEFMQLLSFQVIFCYSFQFSPPLCWNHSSKFWWKVVWMVISWRHNFLIELYMTKKQQFFDISLKNSTPIIVAFFFIKGEGGNCGVFLFWVDKRHWRNNSVITFFKLIIHYLNFMQNKKKKKNFEKFFSTYYILLKEFAKFL